MFAPIASGPSLFIFVEDGIILGTFAAEGPRPLESAMRRRDEQYPKAAIAVAVRDENWADFLPCG